MYSSVKSIVTAPYITSAYMQLDMQELEPYVEEVKAIPSFFGTTQLPHLLCIPTWLYSQWRVGPLFSKPAHLDPITTTYFLKVHVCYTCVECGHLVDSTGGLVGSSERSDCGGFGG